MHDNKEPIILNEHEHLDSNKMLSIIFDYMSQISLETNHEKLLMKMADLGKELVLADRCTVWLHNPLENNIWTVVAHGIEKIIVPENSGLIGHCVITGKAMIVEDAYLDKRFNQEVDQETGYRTRSILCIPFHNTKGEVIGAFQAINKMTASRKFNDKDLEILSLAASYASKSLESSILMYELIETQKEMIETMGEIGESRSQETGNHVKRVAKYSYLLAILAGLSEEEALLLKHASPMHDIGKVATPDRILLKPGKLTEDEYEIMKQHAVIGYNVFKHSRRDLLRAAATIAHEHHEKWDGTGYPNGLSGEAIHIFGRITAIADVFDALGSDRVYKKAWQMDDIIHYMIEQQGKQFDPILTQLFIDHVDEFIKISDQYHDQM
ncbi:HD domain-containing protein [Psychrobacillus glaciei]|uniref:HD domain-containing protein n=1 Tax=Psychrobacillus glaciei TaxID=2283160 RepID=A0A5J6SIK9_9BACI|nr:HD domain-containing phosphohydrolase [Psychrobacillus glaciei]QFF97785.1 HD domain-containing protein [Psychrobacillus glaciei]